MIPATQLYEAAALVLDTAGAGVWKPDGAYTKTETGIILKKMPTAPDNTIVLTLYGRDTNPSPALTHEIINLQVRVRTAKGRPDSVDTLAEHVTAALHGDHLNWSGIAITKCHRISYLPLGFDANDRPEISLNFQLILPR